jgi:Type I phosphodiesterase / nucleotide pyrophosphatase
VTSRGSLVRVRVFVAAACALLWLVIALAVEAPYALGATGQRAVERQLADTACSLPHQFLLRTWRGWRADRGPDIQMIASEPNYVGSGLPHVGPWEYVQHVPMLWYGPGHIPAVGPVARPVTAAGIAPTQGALLDYPFHPIDGQVMREVLPKGSAVEPPRLLVTLVWDAGGMDVLDAHPHDWPFLKSLIRKGVWYTNATVGSSPTSTAQIHTTIGTGDFPRTSGLVGHRLRIGPNITTPWASGPAYIEEPTLADLYDRAKGNTPIVGLMSTVSIHAGMLGHGAMWGGGDRDIAIFRQAVSGDTLTDETFQWNLPAGLQPYYAFPSYVNDVPGFQADVDAIDRKDGKLDGKWRTNDMSQLLDGFDTPARAPYQEQVTEELVRKEGFGADGVPDLLFINHKIIDYISHIWTLNSGEMRDAVQAEDAALEAFVRFLDNEVGKGAWELLLTADHGAIPKPSISGAFQISTAPIAAGINARFDHDGDSTHIVDLVQPTGIFIDTDELEQNGYTLADVSQWVLGLTEEESKGLGVTVPAGDQAKKVFDAVFPSEMMARLPCLPEARR